MNTHFYSNLPVDIEHDQIVNKYGYGSVLLKTSCSILHLCGNKNEGFKLKLGSIFILFEYERFSARLL